MFRTPVRGAVLAATLCAAAVSSAQAADRTPPAEGIAETLLLVAPAAACPAGAVCFEAPGLVHTPTPAAPVGRVAFLPPAGIATRLKMTMNVTVGPWFPQENDGKHLIYWFVMSKNIDMPGLLYFRGPGKNQAFARHGIGLTHPQKIKIIRPFAAEVGHTYRIENDYDMAGGLYTVRVTDVATGKGVVLRGKPNVSSYTIKAGTKILVDMGFPLDKVETEVPSYGWKYSAVRVEIYRQ